MNNDHNVVNDDIAIWMKAIRETTTFHAIPKGSLTKDMALNDEVDDYFDEKWHLNHFVENDNLTNTITHLSLQREASEMSSLESSVIGKQKSDYQKSLQLFQEAFHVCRDKEQRKNLQNALQKFIFSTVNKNTQDILGHQDGSTFYGADIVVVVLESFHL